MNYLRWGLQMTLDFAPGVQETISLALAEAQHQHSPILGTPHLFIALTKLGGVTAAALHITSNDVANCGTDGLSTGRGVAGSGRLGMSFSHVASSR